jgi:hypothetical protein
MGPFFGVLLYIYKYINKHPLINRAGEIDLYPRSPMFLRGYR